MARLPGFAQIHPHQSEDTVQGALAMLKELEESLSEITGMDAMTLQPAAGAQGELTGLLIMKAYHKKQGNHKTKIMIPDSGHGTNPASCSMCGYQVINVKSNEKGGVDIADLKEKLTPDVAGFNANKP